MSPLDPELLFPAWRQHCLEVALDMVDRVLFASGQATQPGLRLAWQDRLGGAIENPQRPKPPPSNFAQLDISTLSGLTLMSDDEVSENIVANRMVLTLEGTCEWLLREMKARTFVWRMQAEQAYFESPQLLSPNTLVQCLSEALHDCVPVGHRRLELLRELNRPLSDEARRLYEGLVDWLDRHGIDPQHVTVRTGPVLGLPVGDPARPMQTSLREAGRPVNVTPDQIPALLAQISSEAGLSLGMATLMQRLAAPVQRSVRADGRLLASGDNPLWKLIDRMASLAQLDPGRNEPGRPSLDHRLKPLVDALVNVNVPLTADNYEKALAHAERLAMASLPESVVSSVRDQEMLDAAARRSELEPLIHSQMIERLRKQELLPGIRQFLLGPWVQVLALFSATDGVDAESTRRWSLLIDQMIDAGDRLREKPLTPAEVDCLVLEARDGLIEAGQLPDRVRQHEEDLQLELSHWPRLAYTGAMPLDEAPTDAEAGSGSTGREAMETLPQALDLPELPPVHGEGSLDADDSDWAHHGELNTVPISLHDDDHDGVAKKAREAWLNQLKPGDICRIFLQSRWTSVRLDWVSDRNQFFAFSRNRDAPLSTTRRVLERMRAEGLVTTITPGQWVQRAADSLPMPL